MPLDLSFFLLALEQAAGHANGFNLAGLALVESAWQSSLSAARMFGWVVVLATGQRLYIEVEVGGADDGGLPTNLEIAHLPADQRYPDELEKAAWYSPDHINQYFGLGSVLNWGFHAPGCGVVSARTADAARPTRRSSCR